jgi:hypothetical protein
MIQSRFVSELVTKITRCKARSTSGSPVDKLDDLEKRGEQWEELVQTVDATAYLMRGDNPTILFAMYLCFAMASAANFGSLVTFNQSDGVAACGTCSESISLLTVSCFDSIRGRLELDVDRARQDCCLIRHQSALEATVRPQTRDLRALGQSRGRRRYRHSLLLMTHG